MALMGEEPDRGTPSAPRQSHQRGRFPATHLDFTSRSRCCQRFHLFPTNFLPSSLPSAKSLGNILQGL